MQGRKYSDFAQIVIFIVIGIALFIGISYMTKGSLAHTKNNLSGFYAEKENSLDVVLIGTSGSFSAFAPVEAWNDYGFTSYNFGINCLGADVIKYCIKEIYKTQQPEVLVIDCYPFLSGEVAKDCNYPSAEFILRYNIDGFRYSWDRFQLINEVVEGDKISYYFDIMKYHSSHSLEWEYVFYKRHNVQKGFNFLEYGNNVQAIPVQRTEETVELPEELNQIFLDLLERCSELDSRILFVYYPYGYQSEETVKQLNYIREKTKEAGFAFLDCTESYDEIGMDFMQDYWNQGHFNIYGAEKITKYVGSYLTNHYLLEDHRADEAYKLWNDDYRIWTKKVQEEKKKIDEAIIAAKR